MRNVATIVLVIASFLTLRSNRAEAQDKVAADTAFREGRALMQAGKYDEACAKFEFSYSQEAAVGTLLNLADCHEKVKRSASAWVEFTEAAERAEHDGQTKRADEAKRRAAALEPRLTRLQINSTEPRAENVVILRNDTVVTSLVGTAVPVDPGDHVVSVKRGERELWRREVKAYGEGALVTVQLPTGPELDASEAALIKAEPKPQTQQPNGVVLTGSATAKPKRQLTTKHWLAIGAGGVGLASLSAAVVFGISAKSARDDSRESCNRNNICDQAGFDAAQKAQDRALLSNVFGTVGLVAIAGGVVLWVMAPSTLVEPEKAAPQNTATRLAPMVGPDQIGVVLEGGF